MEHTSSVTRLLEVMDQGDPAAFNELYRMVYGELKKLAARQRARWNGDFTINTTVLLHETYEKLVKAPHKNWENRKHFYSVASKAMRNILFTYAESKNAQKRGGDVHKISLEDMEIGGSFTFSEHRVLDILSLEEAMKNLEAVSPREAKIVEYRFYLGLNVEETAELLGVGRATVIRGWAMAKAWLFEQLNS